jgi:hypothetical protein
VSREKEETNRFGTLCCAETVATRAERATTLYCILAKLAKKEF